MWFMRLPTVVVRGDVLLSWLTLSDYSRTQLAKELGVSTGRVSQLLNSTEEPSAHLMAKLLHRTNLPFTRLFRIIHRKPSASVKTSANGRQQTGTANAVKTLGH